MGDKVPPEEIIPKPEALKRYQQAESLHCPYVAGGLEDQPYIWLMEHGVVDTYLQETRAIDETRRAQMRQNAS